MTDPEILASANQIFQAIFRHDNPFDLKTLEQKFAFDIKLPVAVKDSLTGATTFSAIPGAQKFITAEQVEAWDRDKGWLQPRRKIQNISEILDLWQEINYITSGRVYDSEHVSCSDPIYGSRYVHKSTNCGGSNHLIFCDGIFDSNFTMASQRSTGLNYCLRVDDSNTCSNSYSVICSSKISNSLFIQDASDLHECMFCSHLSNQEYCIANMQFEKGEYMSLKQQIIQRMLKS